MGNTTGVLFIPHWHVTNRRLLEPIGNIPPAESEMAYRRQEEKSAIAA